MANFPALTEVIANIILDGSGNDVNKADLRTHLSEIEAFYNTLRALLESSDGGAAEGPTFPLLRESASPAANDLLAALAYQGMNDAGTPEVIDYFKRVGKILDQTDGSEDGGFEDYAMVAGTSTKVLELLAAGVFNFTNWPQVGGNALSGPEVLASQTLSATASPVSFQSIFTSAHKKVEIILANINASADDVGVRVQFMRGATAVTTGSYYWVSNANGAGGAGADANGSDTHFPLCREFDVGGGLGNDTGEALNATVTVYHPNDGANYLQYDFRSTVHIPDGNPEHFYGGGDLHDAVTAVDGVQVAIESGNFASGEILVLGYR